MARRPAQEIADALRSEILAGNLRPGDQVPSEHELARGSAPPAPRRRRPSPYLFRYSIDVP